MSNIKDYWKNDTEVIEVIGIIPIYYDPTNVESSIDGVVFSDINGNVRVLRNEEFLRIYTPCKPVYEYQYYYSLKTDNTCLRTSKFYKDDEEFYREHYVLAVFAQRIEATRQVRKFYKPKEETNP